MANLFKLLCLSGALIVTSQAQQADSKSDADFKLLAAPTPKGLLLKKGDRLALCGDSITEQKMYSRIIETYLTVAVPDLEITVRQYGWSGETAPGFLARMTNDCLRFHPTIATTCYGMNDHGYRRYEPSIGQRYRDASTAIVQAFKQAGARMVLGSPGCVGKRPNWSRDTNSTIAALNENLCELRNIDVKIAEAENVNFADTFGAMINAGRSARQRYGSDYAIAGKDGVHPDWAGQLVMAYAFLRGLGLDGEIGTISVDLAENKASASSGHQVTSFMDGRLQIVSRRYPFCVPAGDATKDNSVRSGMTLVPFHKELNRLLLVVKNANAPRYKVTWGTESKSFAQADLAKGINLAEEFPTNPFSQRFAKVDAAVAAKQAYETRQIKDLFHGPEGKTDPEATAVLTEKVRAPLAAAIKTAFVPVSHELRIEAD